MSYDTRFEPAVLAGVFSAAYAANMAAGAAPANAQADARRAVDAFAAVVERGGKPHDIVTKTHIGVSEIITATWDGEQLTLTSEPNR
jgi:hypothetical protein